MLKYWLQFIIIKTYIAFTLRKIERNSLNGYCFLLRCCMSRVYNEDDGCWDCFVRERCAGKNCTFVESFASWFVMFLLTVYERERNENEKKCNFEFLLSFDWTFLLFPFNLYRRLYVWVIAIAVWWHEMRFK